MSRRIVIVPMASDMLPLVVARMPAGVALTGQWELFDKPWSEARFEGEGLPPWAELPMFSTNFPRATVCVAGDGNVYFLPWPEGVPTVPQETNAPPKDTTGHRDWLKKQFGMNN